MRCPTPDKTAYWTRRRALRALVAARRKHWPQRRIYQCACGAWHLTSQPGGSA